MTKIVFPKYMSDGPGFAGTVEIEIDGQRATLSTTAPGNSSTRRVSVTLVVPFPPIAGVDMLTQTRIERLWAAMSESERDYYGEPQHIDPARARWLTMDDGQVGAVVIGGEPNIVSFYILRDVAGVAETVDFEDAARVVETVSQTDGGGVDAKLDELALIGAEWSRCRAQGHTPKHIKTALLAAAMDALTAYVGQSRDDSKRVDFPQDFKDLMRTALTGRAS